VESFAGWFGVVYIPDLDDSEFNAGEPDKILNILWAMSAVLFLGGSSLPGAANPKSGKC
jgi:hypothetical protein